VIVLRVASGAMTALFVVSAGLQLNDPDPVGWTAIYLAAAVAAGCGAARRLWWPFAAAVGAVALAWAASFGGRVLESGMLRDLAKAMGPGTHAEEAREFLGLAIVVVWMMVLCLARRSLSRSH
jgi:hypothetical protein